MITASVVTYNHCLKDIEPVLKSLTSSPVNHIFVIDHSNRYKGLESELKEFQKNIEKEHATNPDSKLIKYQQSYFNYQNSTNITYIKHKNNGYGGGHNVALRKAKEMGMKYHLVVNPDVWFDENVIPSLINYMDDHEDVGQMMPKVLFPDGSVQRLAKLLPAPRDMFGRFFLLRANEERNRQFELRDSEFKMTLNAPYLSGCFMFFRMEAIEKVDFFDEHLFMYAEDIDITRRIHEHYKTLYYPELQIYHKFSRADRKELRLMWIHITNIIMYFNKWGWFSDEKRDIYNKEVLDDIKRQNKK